MYRQWHTFWIEGPTRQTPYRQNTRGGHLLLQLETNVLGLTWDPLRDLLGLGNTGEGHFWRGRKNGFKRNIYILYQLGFYAKKTKRDWISTQKEGQIPLTGLYFWDGVQTPEMNHYSWRRPALRYGRTRRRTQAAEMQKRRAKIPDPY